ncbi:phage major capsid protein [Desulfobaculum sp. SPO524]|uniref:phage major capsid protein n=1 Tax=Desulfobaculum sp. SPO524 TaxID=3378071 RepID=UPI003853AF21
MEAMMPKTKPTLEQIQSQNCRAYFPVEMVRSVDEEKRTVEIAFSSDREIEQFWLTILVLEHSASACDLNRLNNGGAVLFNHNRSAHIGVVESARIDGDGKGRAVVRFSRSPLGEEKFRDVVDGVLRHVSVGFEVDEVKLVESRKDDVDVYRATKWTPYEISFVTIPADDSVGVGRDHGGAPKPETMEGRGMPQKGATPKGENGAGVPPVDVTAERDAAVLAERQRMDDLLKMGREYNAPEEAERFVREGKSPDQFRQLLLERMNQKADKPSPDEMNADVGLSERELKRYSFVKVLRALDPNNLRAREAAAFELEVSNAAAQHLAREVQGIVVPPEVLQTPLARTYTTDSGAAPHGGALVGTELLESSFIELLRKRCLLMQLGSKLGGLVGNVDIPKQISGATGYVVGEDQDVPESDGDFGTLSLSPYTIGGMCEVSRRLLMQTSLDVEATIRSDLSKAVALKLDSLGFYGTGTDEPLGLKFTAGVNAITFGTASQPTHKEMVQMESEISADDADVESMAYLLNARMRGHCKTTPRMPSGEKAIMTDGGQINGYPVGVTNQVQGSDVFFGNWADLMIAMWGGLELTLDPYTHSQKGRLRIIAMQDADIGVRNAESFCVGTSA